MTTPSVRDRLLNSTVVLLRTKGADGFGMAELVEHSGVARKSMYQHFPEGKGQLLNAATESAALFVSSALGHMLERESTADGLVAWIEYWRRVLIDSDFTFGCPLVAASLAAAEYPDAGATAASAFDQLSGQIAESLIGEGRDPDDAHRAGDVLVASMEGAIVTARATRSTRPFDSLADHVRAVWGTGNPPRGY